MLHTWTFASLSFPMYCSSLIPWSFFTYDCVIIVDLMGYVVGPYTFLLIYLSSHTSNVCKISNGRERGGGEGGEERDKQVVIKRERERERE